MSIKSLLVIVDKLGLPFSPRGKTNAVHDCTEDIHGVVSQGVECNVTAKHLFSAEI